MSDEQRPRLTRPTIERPTPESLRPQVRKPVLIVAAVTVVAVIGFLSTRVGPLKEGASLAGPIAVADPSHSAVPALSPADLAAPSPSVASSPATTDWTAVIEQLDLARVAVFESPGSAPLVDADRPASVAYRRDDAIRALLAAQNVRARGMRFVLRSVRLLSLSGPIATLAVTDELGAYSIIDAYNRVVERRPARAAQKWLVTIRHDNGRWRFTDVHPM